MAEYLNFLPPAPITTILFTSIDGPRVSQAVVAEWLRRLTRNQFRSAGVGSNPTDRDFFFLPDTVVVDSMHRVV